MLNSVLKARYYDGKTSAPQAVELRIDNEGWLTSEQPTVRVHVDQINFRPRIGSAARQLIIQDGGSLETNDHDLIDAICERWDLKPNESLLHDFESSLKWVSISLLSFIGLMLVGYIYGLPALSHRIAFKTPASIQAVLGENTLEQLDSKIFKPSQLNELQQAAITTQFEALQHTTNEPLDLQFRRAPMIGPNALALPDGTIIVTDELVNLLGDNADMQGILLHEIGHIQHRHSLQLLARKATLSAVILSITGDVSAASSLVLTLPGLLLENSFSRDFETESDEFALQHIQALGLSFDAFAESMQALSGGDPTETDSDDTETNNWQSYFSTHPITTERIKKIRAYAKESPINQDK